MHKRAINGLLCLLCLLAILSIPALGAAAKTDPAGSGVAERLETEKHRMFLHGYYDGSFRPNGYLTRAEAARMFYRLLKDKDVPRKAKYKDVPEGAWYEVPVNALTGLGIMKGTGKRTFAPDRPITRAEFVTVAMRFARRPEGASCGFSDVREGDWYYEAVSGAVSYGWINGYKDNTFRPNEKITRAEVAVIVNRMLGRKPDAQYIDAHFLEIRKFTDMDAGTCWAYYNIVEASNRHAYSSAGGVERWTKLK